MRIYREPANLFVAGFVGTPTTNLWEGTVTLRDGAWWFEEKTADSANGFALPVAEEHAGALRSHLGRPIIVGLRPEHVAVVEASRLSSPGMITAMVRIVERTGTESWLHCASAAQKITARAGAEAAGAKAGDSVRLVTDLSQARYFDPVTQQAIC
jgi:multiple sugar transport system ATP-binding protein